MPKRSKGRDQATSDPESGPPGWNLGVGLATRPNKKTQTVAESRSIDNQTTLTGGVTVGAVMTLFRQIQCEA